MHDTILFCSCATIFVDVLPYQDGFTPVMIAAQNKNREIIELLAGAHADLNIKEKVWESFFNYY